MDIDQIGEEVRKREILSNLVDEIILSKVKKNPRKRIRRGVVHNFVCEVLQVTNSSRLRTLVNQRMVALGHPMIIVHGFRYYAFAELK